MKKLAFLLLSLFIITGCEKAPSTNDGENSSNSEETDLPNTHIVAFENCSLEGLTHIEITTSSTNDKVAINFNTDNEEIRIGLSTDDINDIYHNDPLGQEDDLVIKLWFGENVSSKIIHEYFSVYRNTNDETSNSRITLKNIHTIDSAQDLDDIRKSISGFYIQTSDIDLSGFENWTPIGDDSSFAGSFDGCGFKIKNLKIAQSTDSELKFIGLFGKWNSKRQIMRNIHITDADITVDSENTIFVGGIVGYMSESHYFYELKMESCSFDGQISATGPDNVYVGGIVGYHFSGRITECVNRGAIKASGTKNVSAGGISSRVIWGYITHCENYGSIEAHSSFTSIYENNLGTAEAGGIAGSIWSEYILACANYGSIAGSGDQADVCVGGISGANSDAKIFSCLNQGAAKANSQNRNAYLGGVVGLNESIINSSWDEYATIAGCYSTGKLEPQAIEETPTKYFTGGICGLNSATGSTDFDSKAISQILDCYWDAESSFIDVAVGKNESIETGEATEERTDRFGENAWPASSDAGWGDTAPEGWGESITWDNPWASLGSWQSGKHPELK